MPAVQLVREKCNPPDVEDRHNIRYPETLYAISPKEANILSSMQ
jgi:hypothetical protein